MSQTPKKWHEVYRNDDEKKLFVGKDGKSGLCRSEFAWRTTERLHVESGLSNKRVEEILDHWCQKGVVIQHTKDPEKWGYWERVGADKGDPDLVKKDHTERMDKQHLSSGNKKPGAIPTKVTTAKGVGAPTAAKPAGKLSGSPTAAPTAAKPAVKPTP